MSTVTIVNYDSVYAFYHDGKLVFQCEYDMNPRTVGELLEAVDPSLTIETKDAVYPEDEFRVPKYLSEVEMVD